MYSLFQYISSHCASRWKYYITNRWIKLLWSLLPVFFDMSETSMTYCIHLCIAFDTIHMWSFHCRCCFLILQNERDTKDLALLSIHLQCVTISFMSTLKIVFLHFDSIHTNSKSTASSKLPVQETSIQACSHYTAWLSWNSFRVNWGLLVIIKIGFQFYISPSCL